MDCPFVHFHKISFHSQSMANWFLNLCWSIYLFLDRHKASLSFNVECRRIGSHFLDFIMKVFCKYFYHVLLFHGAIDKLPNLLDIWCDPKVDSTMLQKDMLKDSFTSHLFQCGWHLECSKDKTPTLEIPLKENIKSSFMEILASSKGTQVEGGRQKITSKDKQKLKKKMTEPFSFDEDQDAFVEVLLSQTTSLQTIKDMRRKRWDITLLVLPTPTLGGV